MWKHMARIIGEVRPRYVLVENHKHLAIRGLGTVLGALATMGYDAEWGVFEAAHAGAPHERARMFILAMANTESIGGQQIAGGLQEDAGQAWQEANGCFEPECGDQNCRRWWHSEPVVGRVADGVAARVDRAKAIGNGQVPQVMAMAFRILHERLSKRVGNGA
jgi:DNA (cytosine-5)-methyltransferase 1